MKKYITGAAALLLFLQAGAQQKQSNVLDLKYSIEDSSIVFPESFETDTQKLLEGWYLKNYTSAPETPASDVDPGATAAIIKTRLANMPTVIEMPYNSIVHQYIERYTKKGRRQVTALLGLSSYYIPIFEQALEEAGLPLELRYLPMIESGLNPNAVSKHGAAGLWQFILATARGYDMEVTSLVDERRDPYISSEKACKMLKDLYNTYGDWSLAIAAYNCGPGNVNKALNRAGGDPKSHDFWSIYYYLPEETRGYVPKFIAANYVMTYYPEHNIAPVLITKPLITDTIHVSDRIHFNQIAAILDIPVEEIRILNPQFRADIIPGSASKTYNLILPSQQVHAYLISEAQIIDYQKDKYARRIEAQPGGDPNAVIEEEQLAYEETEPVNPADIAPAERAAAQEQYDEINPEAGEAATPKRRRGNAETAAQTPAAPAAKPAASQATASTTSKSTEQPKKTEPAKKPAEQTKKKETASTSTKNNNKTDTKKKQQQTKSTPKSHTVSEGENLTVIAKKNGVTVEQLKKANPNLKGDMIHPGDKLSLPKSTSKNDNSKTSNKKKR